jgi:NitT/TauT family transport system permease protein
MRHLFIPNKKIPKTTFLTLCISQVVLALFLWSLFPTAILPKPFEIFKAWCQLINGGEFLPSLITSTVLSLHAIFLTFIISLGISYATVLPFFKPLGEFISKLRFLSLVGLSFIFLLLVDGGHSLKVALLVFCMVVFFVTSMVSVIAEIPQNEYHHARTLGMSEWKILWEVIILGRLDQAFEILRQNFAIAWMMLTMVEGISRSEGGIGALLLNQNKHFQLDAVFAIQITIFGIGICLDYLFALLKTWFFPYSNLPSGSK